MKASPEGDGDGVEDRYLRAFFKVFDDGGPVEVCAKVYERVGMVGGVLERAGDEFFGCDPCK